MTWWRAVAVLVLLVIVGLPVGLPFVGVLRDSHGWLAWTEYERILSLAKTTLQLVLGTLALVLPLGMPRLVPGALEPLLPQVMASLSLGLQVGRRRQAQLQCRRLKHLQHQRRGQGIERLPGHARVG